MGTDDVTLLLEAVRGGSSGAEDRLMEAVYEELHRMAQGRMQRERAEHTLQPTALVNEVFLRLAGNQHQLEDRAHFFGAAAKAMERILVDHARRKRALKRGAGAKRVTLQELTEQSSGSDLDVLELHEALESLERESPRLAGLVRRRYFVGLTLDQIAEIDEISLATAKRRWAFAKAWLFERLRSGAEEPPATE